MRIEQEVKLEAELASPDEERLELEKLMKKLAESASDFWGVFGDAGKEAGKEFKILEPALVESERASRFKLKFKLKHPEFEPDDEYEVFG